MAKKKQSEQNRTNGKGVNLCRNRCSLGCCGHWMQCIWSMCESLYWKVLPKRRVIPLKLHMRAAGICNSQAFQNSVTQSLHSCRSSNLPVKLLLMHYERSSIHKIWWLPQTDLGLAEYTRVSCCALIVALKSIRIGSTRSENHQACKLI